MPLGDANALMPEEHRDSFKRHAGEKEFNRECISEAVRVTLRHLREGE
jgi:hypothetical protein